MENTYLKTLVIAAAMVFAGCIGGAEEATAVLASNGAPAEGSNPTSCGNKETCVIDLRLVEEGLSHQMNFTEGEFTLKIISDKQQAVTLYCWVKICRALACENLSCSSSRGGEKPASISESGSRYGLFPGAEEGAHELIVRMWIEWPNHFKVKPRV